MSPFPLKLGWNPKFIPFIPATGLKFLAQNENSQNHLPTNGEMTQQKSDPQRASLKISVILIQLLYGWLSFFFLLPRVHFNRKTLFIFLFYELNSQI